MKLALLLAATAPLVAQTCSYTLTPSSLTVGAASGLAPSPIQLSTGNGCSWSAHTDAGWMHIVSAASGVGTSSIWVRFDANTTPVQRAGQLMVGNAASAITQQGTPADGPQLNQIESAASYAVAANAAGDAAGAVCPGELVALEGTNMGPATGAGLQVGADGLVTDSLKGVQVLFDGTPAALIYVSDRQINAVVPYSVAGSTNVQVIYEGAASNTLVVPVRSTAPGIFTADSSGTGGGAILNGDDSMLNTYANRTARGGIVVIYCTGGGVTEPGSTDRSVTGLAEPFPRLTQPVSVIVGGISSPNVFYAGAAPAMVAGVTQINAEVPAGVPPGPNSIVVKVGDSQSQPNVLVYVD